MNNLSCLDRLLSQKKCRQVFLVDAKTAETYSFANFYSRAAQLAQYLITQGFVTGDRLGVMLDNSIFCAELYFACLFSGITVVPMNPSWSNSQLDYIIDCTKLEKAVIAAEYQALFNPGSIELFFEDVIQKESISFGCVELPLVGVGDNAEAIIIFTSGTTAQPKGVVHTIRNLVENASAFIALLKLGSHCRFINYLPMTYLGGYYNLLLIPYLAAASVVIVPSFSAASVLNFWDPIIRYHVNVIWFIPTIIAMLLKIDRGECGITYCKENKIFGLVGTAPLHESLRESFELKYAIKLLENYGLTETLFITTQLPEAANHSMQGAGFVLPGLEVNILDDNKCAVKNGKAGEIAVKTPFLMKQYIGADIQLSIEEGYFLTGDVGRFLPDQSLALTSRKKDLIIKGGVNISPLAIESTIYICEKVALCAVVGVPHEISGEIIIAVVQAKNEIEAEEVKLSIKNICQSKLSILHQPDQYLFIEHFPLTASGKIQKNKIRSWAAEKLQHHSLAIERERGVKNPGYFKASHVISNIDQAISIKYNNLVYELKNKGRDIIVLSLGEAFFDIPVFNFDKLPFPLSYHYSHSRGVPELREKLAEYFSKNYDVKFDPESEIIVTAGSKIAIYMAMLALLDPGDEVIIHEPAWVSYPEQVKLCYGVPVQVPYYESVYDFERYISNRTRMIIINNPNNPSGKVYSLEELAHLYCLAKKYNLFILSDEAYSDFVNEKDQFTSLGSLDPSKAHTIIVNSISKNFGISGWRVGYIITNPQLINHLLKANQHLITCAPTILTYYIAQYFTDILSYTIPQIRELLARRERLKAYMDEIQLRYLPGEATFYFFISIEHSTLSSIPFCDRLLQEDSVCVVPGIGYGSSCDQFIRLSMFTETEEKVQIGLNRIKELINKTEKLVVNEYECSV